MKVKTVRSENNREFYLNILEFMNAMQMESKKRLMPHEIKILVEFMLLPDPDFSGYLRFRRRAKELVVENYNKIYESKVKLQYIYNAMLSLREKSVIVKETDGVYRLSPFIEENILNKKDYSIGMRFEIGKIEDGE